MAIYDWDTEEADPFSEAIAQPAALKIILKTKDDPWFLREWYSHHAAIVGPENLIIFDNRSTDPEVLAFYQEVAHDISIFRNPFGVNHIHNVQKCSALYDTLRRTSQICAFLDTDERLMLLEDDSSFVPPSDLAIKLLERLGPEADYAPTLWLGNAFRSRKHFKLSSELDLENALKWGKPVMVSSRIPQSFVNHNCQIAEAIGKVSPPVGLVLLHLSKLYPDQRISGNLRKLESYGFIEPGTSIDAALECDTTRIKKGDPTYWINEIRTLLSVKDHPEQKAQVTLDGLNVAYADASVRDLMRKCL